MEKETVISVTSNAPTDVDIAPLRDGFVAAWSADGVTWFAPLDADGKAAAPAIRVHKRSVDGFGLEVGIDAAPDRAKTFWPASERDSIAAEDLHLVPLGQKRAALLMLVLPQGTEPGGAFACLLDIGDSTAPPAIRLGPAGEYSTQISGAPDGDGLMVVWHDGGLSSSALRMAHLSSSSLAVEKEGALVRDGVAASPALAPVGDRMMLIWSETERNDVEPSSSINTAMISSSLGTSAPKRASRARFLYPSPEAVVVEDKVALTFRDDEDKDDVPEYHFMMLDKKGEAVGKRRRISQADGLRGPSLAFFDGVFVGAAIRSFQRNLLIGVNRFSPEGRKIGGEFQVYADKTDFVRVDIAENKGSMVMIYAEDMRNRGRVLSGRVLCRNEE